MLESDGTVLVDGVADTLPDIVDGLRRVTDDALCDAASLLAEDVETV